MPPVFQFRFCNSDFEAPFYLCSANSHGPSIFQHWMRSCCLVIVLCVYRLCWQRIGLDLGFACCRCCTSLVWSSSACSWSCLVDGHHLVLFRRVCSTYPWSHQIHLLGSGCSTVKNSTSSQTEDSSRLYCPFHHHLQNFHFRWRMFHPHLPSFHISKEHPESPASNHQASAHPICQ